MRSLAAAIVAAVAICGSCACTTVSIPVLRHQTGEALGPKRFRAFGRLETSRIFAPASTDGTAGIAQASDVFKGSLLGVQAEGGVTSALDLQAGANFTSGGGGWRVGGKYQIYRAGRVAVAGMLGYGAASGSGSVTYLTSGTPVEVSQTLSARSIDVSAPVSFRISPEFAAYSGLMLLRTSIDGRFGSQAVSDASSDLGANLGLKVTHGMIEGDIEAALLRVHDPFADGSRFIPYVGIGVGVVF